MQNLRNRAEKGLGRVWGAFGYGYACLKVIFRQVVWIVGFMSLCHLFVGGSAKRLYVLVGAIVFVGIGMVLARKRSVRK